MKNHFLVLILAVLVLASFTADDSSTSEQYVPVLMTRSNLETSIRYEAPRNLENLGKIYTKGTYIYISNHYKGIHVIDNSNPKTPVNIGFINIPGCLDLAIKDSSLYVDNAVDLVTIDISDLSSLKITSRTKEIFPELMPPDKEYIPTMYNKKHRPANTVIVEWRKMNIPVNYNIE